MALCLLMMTSFSVMGDQTNAFIGNTSDLVRIDITQGTVTVPRDAEIVSGQAGQYLDVILPHTSIPELIQAHYSYTVLINDVDSYSDMYRGQYHTFAQIRQILNTTIATYPSITRLTSVGKSYQNRDTWCLEISDNPGVDEGEPGVLFVGVHHAREWPGVEITLNIINQLTSQYATNSTIQNLVNNRRIFVIPCMNPDGYYYSHDQGHDWRKNRHYFPDSSTYGVDLNRNYGGSADGNPLGVWGVSGDGATTHEPSGEVYCGPGPLSENESATIANMFLNFNITTGITYHTYGELVMWPWGYSGSQHTPDNTYQVQIGQQIASRITRETGSGTYTPQQSSALYPTTGDTLDWSYGYSYYIQGKATFMYTIETCEEFQAPTGALDQIVSENFHGAMYLLNEAQNIHDTVIPQVIPPVIDTMANDSDGIYTVNWQEQNPAAAPDAFQLDELTNYSTRIDDAETGSSLWTLNGFTVSTARYHSGSHSYKSRSLDSQISAMTSTSPLPVTNGMHLSFYCWYTAENGFDYAYAEISTNGRYYDFLDSYTGSSGGWVLKDYDLSAYAGKSVFIRFRTTNDDYTSQEGFYVDDITPVPVFGSVHTLSNTITAHSYQITGQDNGTFYYQVKGHNNARGWGDGSMLKSIIVTGGGNPSNPVLALGNFTASLGKVSITVKNTGDVDATNVNVTLSVTGGLLGRINTQKTQVIPALAIGEEVTITTDGFIIGLGKITLSASAYCNDAIPQTVTKTTEAKILLVFITGIQ
jgi:carboxypeptidase T